VLKPTFSARWPSARFSSGVCISRPCLESGCKLQNKPYSSAEQVNSALSHSDLFSAGKRTSTKPQSQFSKGFIFFLSQQFSLALTLRLPQPLRCILGCPSLPTQLGSLPRSLPHDGLKPLSRSDEPRGSHVAAEQARAIWPASPGQRAGWAPGAEQRLCNAQPRRKKVFRHFWDG